MRRFSSLFDRETCACVTRRVPVAHLVTEPDIEAVGDASEQRSVAGGQEAMAAGELRERLVLVPLQC